MYVYVASCRCRRSGSRWKWTKSRLSRKTSTLSIATSDTRAQTTTATEATLAETERSQVRVINFKLRPCSPQKKTLLSCIFYADDVDNISINSIPSTPVLDSSASKRKAELANSGSLATKRPPTRRSSQSGVSHCLQYNAPASEPVVFMCFSCAFQSSNEGDAAHRDRSVFNTFFHLKLCLIMSSFNFLLSANNNFEVQSCTRSNQLVVINFVLIRGLAVV